MQNHQMKMPGNMIKKLLLTLASAFLIWQSIGLIGYLHELKTNSYPLLLFIARIINMFVTGIFAFAGFAHPTHRMLPDGYYRIHAPEHLERLSRWLRVDLFKKFLLATFWRNKQQQKTYFDGRRDGISRFSEKSRSSEFGHVIPLLILTGVSLYLMLVNQYVLGLFTMFFNILGNFYPVLLQRHHRMRIQRLSRRRP